MKKNLILLSFLLSLFAFPTTPKTIKPKSKKRAKKIGKKNKKKHFKKKKQNRLQVFDIPEVSRYRDIDARLGLPQKILLLADQLLASNDLSTEIEDQLQIIKRGTATFHLPLFSPNIDLEINYLLSETTDKEEKETGEKLVELKKMIKIYDASLATNVSSSEPLGNTNSTPPLVFASKSPLQPSSGTTSHLPQPPIPLSSPTLTLYPELKESNNLSSETTEEIERLKILSISDQLLSSDLMSISADQQLKTLKRQLAIPNQSLSFPEIDSEIAYLLGSEADEEEKKMGKKVVLLKKRMTEYNAILAQKMNRPTISSTIKKIKTEEPFLVTPEESSLPHPEKKTKIIEAKEKIYSNIIPEEVNSHIDKERDNGVNDETEPKIDIQEIQRLNKQLSAKKKMKHQEKGLSLLKNIFEKKQQEVFDAMKEKNY